MTNSLRWGPRALVLSVAALALTAGPAFGSSSKLHGAAAVQQALKQYVRAHGGATSATHTANDGDLAGQLAAYAWERTAPAMTVSGQALLDARAEAAQLPTFGGAWTEDTSKPYNADPGSPYTDPFWSNIGSGFSIVGGRTTALVRTHADTWLAGMADGGVWRSTDHGSNWTPVFDSMPTTAIGAMAVAPDGSIWVGTGEANTSFDAYAGTGVYRSTNDGLTWNAVTSSDGSNPIVSQSVYRIAFDGSVALAATSGGLFRYSGGNWSEVLPLAPASDPQPYYDNQVTDVAVDPANTKDVITVIGWRGPLTPDSHNGFFLSTDSGKTFTQVKPTGDINASDIGRTTFAYSADGKKLYAVVESPSMLAAGDASVLQGVFVSANGPAGFWHKIADSASLAAAPNSASSTFGTPGGQAWYDQDITVDPKNDNHVFVGLEEVYETTDGGKLWDTASPYWNYGLSCNSSAQGCPNVTHPDQHAIMIADGKIVIGNDGGVYSRPVAETGLGNWSDLNATLHSLQYYGARAGDLNGGVGIWGGMQDNGSSLLIPGQSQMVEPAGGDGGNVIVDPTNANNLVGEYVYLTMYSSTNGGQSFNSFVSPGCAAQSILGEKPRGDCDPNARFIAPFTTDQNNINDWVAGGQYVWTSSKGWATKCGPKGCNWNKTFNTGSGNVITALSDANGTIYAAWVNGSGNPTTPASSFTSGIATNAGGGPWHQVSTTGLPKRFIAGVTVDKSNTNHAFAVFSGYSRRWIPSAGVGHVFETFDGGKTWTDISGNLPDIPADALTMVGNRLVLTTDIGAFTALDGGGTGTSWSQLGSGLPNVAGNDVSVGPDGNVYNATHGRGVWSITP